MFATYSMGGKEGRGEGWKGGRAEEPIPSCLAPISVNSIISTPHIAIQGLIVKLKLMLQAHSKLMV